MKYSYQYRFNLKELQPVYLLNSDMYADGVRNEIRMALKCSADKGLGEMKWVGW